MQEQTESSMTEMAQLATRPELGSPTKDRVRFARVLDDCIRDCGIDVTGSVLVVGGSFEDVAVLHRAGFKQMTLSNIQQVSREELHSFEDAKVDVVCEDAEAFRLADESYDLVIAHEVLHHCRSPHRALLEMLRVSRRHVIILEPNHSWIMKALISRRFSFPYELPAVIDHNYVSGGVRDSGIPNYIYRWDRDQVFQTVSSFMPERLFALYTRPYWDFNIDRNDLALRQQTRLGTMTRLLGPDNFLRWLRYLQLILNNVPGISAQGNKFFCCVEKRNELQPWLVRDRENIVFNREFGGRK
jgi:SAM-dependent methyltransferase